MESITNSTTLNATERQNLILALLKADLLNKKLIVGLTNAGLTVEDFYIDLLDPLYTLMGFRKEEQDDNLDTLYFNATDKICSIPLNEFFIHRKTLALELYAELLAEKKIRDRDHIAPL